MGHCDLELDLWPSFYNYRIRSISLILFEVGISNLVCECILGWGSVAYHNWVTVNLNLTSDRISRNCIVSGAYLLYSFRLEFQIWCLNAYWDDRVSHIPFWVTVTLTSDLVLRIFVFGAYLLSVILFGHFWGRIWESFPIQKWPLFSQFHVF